ncbi:hypothetical protein [Embleya sp. NPDC020886]|uniref:hypothetical protein n=1 Tax=Embleya sp. NPDC020886 TaxID=3363980 RepID=UPI0037ABE7A7
MKHRIRKGTCTMNFRIQRNSTGMAGVFRDGSTRLGRREVLVSGAAAVLAACTSSAAKEADGDTVRRDSAPLERRFPMLGPLFDARWLGDVLGVDSRMSVPGPSDVRVVGFARLRAGGVAAIVATPGRDFRPATPSTVPDALTRFVPKDARWVGSKSFDSEMTREVYPGAFHLDPGTDTVYFDTIDPSIGDGTQP